jgi:putative tricarboxylic transport membrane protein
MNAILAALQAVFELKMLFFIFGGTALGILVGALPGLSATMGLAVVLPLTFYMKPAEGLIVLCGMYVGALYGGSFSAILLNIPGTPPAVMTGLDGYPMAQRGEAGRAIGISTISSFIGGLFGVICLIVIAPLLAKVALSFGPPEFTLLAIFGLSAIVAVASESLLRGFVGIIIGLLLATVGMDPFTSVPRFTFDRVELMSGISYVPVVIGMFGLAEVLSQSMEFGLTREILQKVKNVIPGKTDILKIMHRFLPPSIIGTLIGVLPGAGGTIASIISYNQAVQTSKEPDKYGTGIPEGVIAAETANNAEVGGSLVPLLTLGIPGSSPAAILLGAMMIHNLSPGPMLFIRERVLVDTIFIGLIVAQFALLIVGLLMAKAAPYIISIRKEAMLPIIALLCVVGSYALKNSYFDLLIMLVFGVLGFFLKEIGVKPPPIILGLILGPLAENNLRSTLEISDKGLIIFITRPICIVLLILTLLVILYPLIQKRMKAKKKISGVAATKTP